MENLTKIEWFLFIFKLQILPTKRIYNVLSDNSNADFSKFRISLPYH